MKMSNPDYPSRTTIPEHLMLSRLAQSEQMREFFIQMWLQNPVLAKQEGSKVQNLLSPLTVINAKESSCTDFPDGTTDKRQRGFSLVSAIFLLVVIAALGTFAVTLSTTQQHSTAMDVMGARAYQAARIGIEWGTFQVLQNPAGALATSCQPGPATQPVTPLPNTLADFNVNVACSSNASSEAGATVTIYQLTSTASAVASPGNVERQISATIAD